MMTSISLRASAWAILAFIVFVTVSPINLRPHTLITVNIDRAAAYAVVGALFALAYPKNWKTTAILLVIGAAGFEFLQIFSSTRHARIEDAMIKALGALVGVAIGHYYTKTRARPASSI
jgi:VanZ family protein